MALLTSGEKLGPYEILEQLGAGGMGEVWKARDSRLNRLVAIKKTQGQFSERFEREAQAIAALNHPHICQLYDVGPDYLVMEYVEGKPLTGPLPLAQALAYSAQICDALDAAHRRGITHRDLKPGNILMGKSGIKILDFGLAKIEHAPGANDSEATMTMPLTGAGMIMGTLQYMSPEQLEGREADARSDIFAFGLILYEILTGKRPFTGSSQATLIASLIKEPTPPLQTGDARFSPALERVVKTCLEKDPDQRWQSAREIRHALEWIQTEGPAPSTIASAPPKKSWLWPAMAAALAILAGVALWAPWQKPPEPPHLVRFEIPLPQGVEFGNYVSVSPDGRKLLIHAAGGGGFWIRDLDGVEWRKLAGTEGATSPFWSPDNRFLGFVVQNELRKMDLTGGPPQMLGSAPGSGTGSWNGDGVIVFGGRGNAPIRRISASGGVPADITAVDASKGQSFHALPVFLPDGKHFIYFRQGVPDVAGVYAGSLDNKPSEQPGERLVASAFAGSYSAGSNGDGYLFFLRGATLMAQPFDAGRLRLQGDPVPIADRVAMTGATGVFSVSKAGVLAYRAGAPPAKFQLTWYDREGHAGAKVDESGPGRPMILSPDGTRGVGRDADQGLNGDIWALDFARGVRTRLTFRNSPGSWPVLSPDGSRMIFAAGNTLDTLYEKSSSGAGEEKELHKKAGEIKIPSDWSRDGRFLLYTTTNGPKGNDLWVLPLEGDRKPVLLLGTEFAECCAYFSPDGHWVLYVSNESGRNQLYVRPFVASGPSLGDGKWQVSKDLLGGGGWRSDGKEIIFNGSNNSVMAVEVNASGTAFQMGTPKELFAPPPGTNSWTVTPDGKRFLMTVPTVQEKPAEAPITVVLNWQSALKK